MHCAWLLIAITRPVSVAWVYRQIAHTHTICRFSQNTNSAGPRARARNPANSMRGKTHAPPPVCHRQNGFAYESCVRMRVSTIMHAKRSAESCNLARMHGNNTPHRTAFSTYTCGNSVKPIITCGSQSKNTAVQYPNYDT